MPGARRRGPLVQSQSSVESYDGSARREGEANASIQAEGVVLEQVVEEGVENEERAEKDQ